MGRGGGGLDGLVGGTVGAVTVVVDSVTDAVFNNSGGAYNVVDGLTGDLRVPDLSGLLGLGDLGVDVGDLLDGVLGVMTGLTGSGGDATPGTILGKLSLEDPASALGILGTTLGSVLEFDDTGLIGSLTGSLGLDNTIFGSVLDLGNVLNLVGESSSLFVGTGDDGSDDFTLNLGSLLMGGGGVDGKGGVTDSGAMLGILSGIAGKTVSIVLDTLTMNGGTLSVGDNGGGNALLKIGELVSGATGALHVGDNLADVVLGDETGPLTMTLGSITNATTDALGGLFSIMYHENSLDNKNLSLGNLTSMNVVVGVENILSQTVGDALLTINSLNVGEDTNSGIFNGLGGVAVNIVKDVTVTAGSLLNLTGAGSSIGGSLTNKGGVVNILGATVDGLLDTVGGLLTNLGDLHVLSQARWRTKGLRRTTRTPLRICSTTF